MREGVSLAPIEWCLWCVLRLLQFLEDARKLKFRRQVRPFSLIKGGSLGHTQESGAGIAPGRKAFSLLAACLKEEQKPDGDEG